MLALQRESEAWVLYAKAMSGGADEYVAKPRLAYLRTSGTEEVLLAICFAS